MIYKAARGSRLTDDQAQKYGDHISKTFSNGHLEVTPEEVVEDARSSTAPTHEFFEWDDSAAAEQYRLEQARYMIRSIFVVVEEQTFVKETRAFVHVTIQEPEQEPRKVYTTVQHALTEEDLRKQTIEYALNQLDNWRKRWNEYTELADVLNAVKETVDQARELLVLEPA